jgi:hypothetical protein
MRSADLFLKVCGSSPGTAAGGAYVPAIFVEISVA